MSEVVRRSRLFVVDSVDDVRWNCVTGGREYLTSWRGYARRTWNQHSDFGDIFDDVLLLQDFLAVVPRNTEEQEAANLLLNLKKY